MVRIALVLALALVAGCPKGSEKPGVPSGPMDERQACTVDKDCVAVELDCCDHCNGGRVLGVHRDFATDVRKEQAPASECGMAKCTKMACIEQPVGICRQQRCGVAIGDKEDLSALPRP